MCGKRTSHIVMDKWCCTEHEEGLMSLEDMFEENSGGNNRSVILDIRDESKYAVIDLIGFGDWHYGANNCNVQKIQNQIDWIKDNDRARVILMGDLLECATKRSVGAGNVDSLLNPQQQYDHVIKMLDPIKEKIYGMHQGNHEERIYNDTGINLTKMMAKELGTRYLGYSAFHKIKVGKVNYTAFTAHGSSGATLPHTKIKGCMNMAMGNNSDLYMMGHVHALQTITQQYRRVDLKNKKVIVDKRYYVLTGHYLNYSDSYADMKLMTAEKQGCAKVRLDGTKKDIHISL